ncbi:MAG: VOC family protein, partial [Methyloligellaceae bacterium]
PSVGSAAWAAPRGKKCAWAIKRWTFQTARLDQQDTVVAQSAPRRASHMIKGLHHAAYRCRDSEETRQFYEDFLGLPLANAFEITEPKSGRGANVLHSFFRMDDGSFLAFFEAPSRPFAFRDQHDFDLHIALEVDAETLDRMFEAGKKAGIDTRGIADHGFIRSIYFRDPNGYVVELSAKVPDSDGELSPGEARAALDSWQETKRGT